MIWIVNAKHIKDYYIYIQFNNGEEKTVNLQHTIFDDDREIFIPLRDKKYFANFKFNKEIDTIEWPNGLDLAPEFLYNLENIELKT